MIDIQYGITIMGGREVSRPYQVGFLCFVFVPQNLSTEPLYGGAEGEEKNSHRFFGIFIRLNLCEINGLLFEPCSALSNF